VRISSHLATIIAGKVAGVLKQMLGRFSDSRGDRGEMPTQTFDEQQLELHDLPHGFFYCPILFHGAVTQLQPGVQTMVPTLS
jgi:hypothetical protein